MADGKRLATPDELARRVMDHIEGCESETECDCDEFVAREFRVFGASMLRSAADIADGYLSDDGWAIRDALREEADRIEAGNG